MLKLPILLKPRFLSVKNTLFKGKHRFSFLALIILALFAVPYSSFKMIKQVSLAINSTDVMFSILELLFVTLFSVQFLSSTIHALQSLFLSKDTELLLVAPITKKRIFISKYVENLFASSWVLILLILPLTLGVTAPIVGWNFWFYFLLVLFILFSLCTISALGMATTVILSKLYPARSLKEFLLLCSIGLIIILHQYSRSTEFLLPQNINQVIEDSKPVQKFEQAQESFTRWQKAITEKGKGIFVLPLKAELSNAIASKRAEFIGLIFIIALVSILAAFRIFSDFYAPAEILEKWQQVNKKRTKGWLKFNKLRILSFLQKDLHLFLRDLAQPVQLILFLVIGAVTLLSLRQTDQLRISFGADSIVWETFIGTVLILTHLLFTVLFCGRFVFPTLLLEEESDWLLKSSPISAKKFVHLKYFSQLILTSSILIPIYLSLAFATNMSVASILKGAAISLVHVTTITACAIGSGGTLPFFKFEHLGQVSSGIGSFIFMLTSMLLIPLLLIISLAAALLIAANFSFLAQGSAQMIFLILYASLSLIVVKWFLNKASVKWVS